jgi:hypothetical protein
VSADDLSGDEEAEAKAALSSRLRAQFRAALERLEDPGE